MGAAWILNLLFEPFFYLFKGLLKVDFYTLHVLFDKCIYKKHGVCVCVHVCVCACQGVEFTVGVCVLIQYLLIFC